jgi:hypothetical protein
VSVQCTYTRNSTQEIRLLLTEFSSHFPECKACKTNIEVSHRKSGHLVGSQVTCYVKENMKRGFQ